MYKVKKKFRDKDTNKMHQPGDSYSTNNEREEKKLLNAGYITKQGKQMEAATMPDNTEKKADIKHLGGGWYQLPDGRKVRKSELQEGD